MGGSSKDATFNLEHTAFHQQLQLAADFFLSYLGIIHSTLGTPRPAVTGVTEPVRKAKLVGQHDDSADSDGACTGPAVQHTLHLVVQQYVLQRRVLNYTAK